MFAAPSSKIMCNTGLLNLFEVPRVIITSAINCIPQVIDGHVVQINETTYTDGDENHMSFYHVKEVQELPSFDESAVQKKVPEKITSAMKDDPAAQNEETNEIKGPVVTTVDSPSGAVDDSNKESLAKKVD